MQKGQEPTTSATGDTEAGQGPTPSLDATAFVAASSTADLLRLYGSILDELRLRDVVRSRNAPAGDLAEYLAAVVYGGELAPPSEKSWDVQAPDGRLVQVKCRVVRNGQAGNYSFFRSYAFDVCVFVQLDSTSYDVVSAIEVPSAAVESRARASTHVNGSRIALSEGLAELPGAVDLTTGFRQAFETLRLPRS